MTLCVDWRTKLGDFLSILASEAHDGELAAFISYAMAFPKTFVALIDTYDVPKYVDIQVQDNHNIKCLYFKEWDVKLLCSGISSQ